MYGRSVFESDGLRRVRLSRTEAVEMEERATMRGKQHLFCQFPVFKNLPDLTVSSSKPSAK